MKMETEELLRQNRQKYIRFSKNSEWLSLAMITGKNIVDVEGCISQEFGLDTPVFNICNIVFSDGSVIRVQGEHDTAYLPAEESNGLRRTDMLKLMEPGDVYEDYDGEFDEYLK